jgi:hypothetical protein
VFKAGDHVPEKLFIEFVGKLKIVFGQIGEIAVKTGATVAFTTTETLFDKTID